jgi:hypothetical protein
LDNLSVRIGSFYLLPLFWACLSLGMGGAKYGQ